jgi:hypothetical protein
MVSKAPEIATTVSAAVLILLALQGFGCGPSGKDIPPGIDPARLALPGEDWEVLREEADAAGGSIRLHLDQWLMYFTHWRPLDEERSNLTPESARNTLLTFWGNMPFTLTGEEGEMEVSGHPARYVEAKLRETVHTRFIIWNCPESGRQLIADTNINIRMGTPAALLDLQREMALSTSCHGETIPYRDEFPGAVTEFPKFGLAFPVPENWRSREYPDPVRYPDGSTPSSGSLWTLPTDSRKMVERHWREDGRPIDRALMNEYLSLTATSSTTATGTVLSVGAPRIDRYHASSGYLEASGGFDMGFRAEGQEWTDPYRFHAFLWRKGGQVHILVASIIAIRDMWGIPNDLGPSPERLQQFLEEQVCPSLEDGAQFCRDF